MNNKKSKLNVAIIIYDLDCDPDRLTTLLGLSPSSIERVGDKTLTGLSKVDSSNCWELKSDLKDELDLDSHVKFLISKLGDLSRISSISQKWGVKLDCYIQFYGSDNSPTLFLSTDVIETLGKWRCFIDIDYSF